ncbi:peptidoglycan endopeptidase [Periweissella cryptocerci]|uniref:Peptidoglycan endopeptidase n=1 Tax=Periweissella cryptocerci TaxID=2506420 RepID=A0A4P6YSN9_9LACO|nr:C40 family peptidase [Periweissella cryptocerci]QBO35647.1 peptidoglycan endopeptidase [Periweissella cryptocerci]
MMKKLFVTFATLALTLTIGTALAFADDLVQGDGIVNTVTDTPAVDAATVKYAGKYTGKKQDVTGYTATVKKNGDLFKVSGNKKKSATFTRQLRMNSLKGQTLTVTKKVAAVVNGKKTTIYWVQAGTIQGWTKKANLKFKSTSKLNGASIVKYAKQFKGVPYVWGGTTPRGFDCSGYVQYVYKHVYHVNVGRTSRDQAALVNSAKGTKVSANNAKAGDILVWTRGGASTAYHAALASGNKKFMQAVQPGTGLNINSSYANGHFKPSYAIRVNLNKLPKTN